MEGLGEAAGEDNVAISSTCVAKSTTFFLDNGYIKNIRPLAKSTTCVAKSIGCVVRFVTGTMRAMRDRWLEVAHVG